MSRISGGGSRNMTDALLANLDGLSNCREAALQSCPFLHKLYRAYKDVEAATPTNREQQSQQSSWKQTSDFLLSHAQGLEINEKDGTCQTSIAAHPRFQDSKSRLRRKLRSRSSPPIPKDKAKKASLWGGEDINHQPGWRIICGSCQEFR